MPENKVTVVNAPSVTLSDGELAGDVLCKFYRALGWDGKDLVDPCKVRTTQDVYQRLYVTMLESCNDAVTVGMAMLNKGPGVDAEVSVGKVWLLDGWLTPDTEIDENAG